VHSVYSTRTVARQRRIGVANAEIEAIRAQLAAHPRPANLAERRKRLDALGTQYALPPDVSVEPVTANGVPAE
jgi:epsilon-lactone hydrolase